MKVDASMAPALSDARQRLLTYRRGLNDAVELLTVLIEKNPNVLFPASADEGDKKRVFHEETNKVLWMIARDMEDVGGDKSVIGLLDKMSKSPHVEVQVGGDS